MNLSIHSHFAVWVERFMRSRRIAEMAYIALGETDFPK